MKIPKILRDLVNTTSLILLIVSAIAMFLLQFFLEQRFEFLVVVAVPAILLVILFSLMSLRLSMFEETIRNVLESRLPEISFINDAEILKKEFIKAVEESEQFIMATGGKSALADYLSKIEEKVNEENIFYRRVVTGKKMTRELFEHLSRLINRNNVSVAWNMKEYIPMLLITEKVAIFSLPDPMRGRFETCIRIPNKEVVDRVRLYTEEWLMKSRSITNLSKLRSLVKQN